MNEQPGETQPGGPASQSFSPAAPSTVGASPGRPARPGPATRDGQVVFLAWDGILLLITAALVGVAILTTPQAHLADIIRPVGYFGLVAAGLAFSLRTGTPNLAVGAIATATGVLGAHLATTDGWSLWAAMTVAVAVAAVTGLIAGLITAALSVPAWAVTIAVALLAQSAAAGISAGQPVLLHVAGSYPTALWLVIVAVISIGGGGLWLLPMVRTTFSATRDATEPGRWAGLPAGLGAVIGLTGSSLLAGLGGVSLAIYLQLGDPASGGTTLTFTALAAVLFGGVSIFGRRAGVIGTLLGAIVVQAMLFVLTAHAVSPFWIDAPIGALALLGLGVSRGLEAITNALA